MLIISEAILFCFIALVVVEIVLIIKKVPIARNFVILTFGLYITLVLSITLFPIIYQEIGYDYEYNFIPFKSILSSIQNFSVYSLMTLAGNAVLLAPFGLAMPIIFFSTQSAEL